MAERYFVQKSVEISQNVINQLKAEFNLSDKDVDDIKYYHSNPHGGAVIYPGGPFTSYPHDGGEEKFCEEFPEPKGEIWKPK